MSNITLTSLAPRTYARPGSRTGGFPVASEAGYALLFLASLALALLA